MDKIAPDGPVYQAGTLSGNPLAMAAGLAMLEAVAQPGFHKTLAAKTTALMDGLRNAAKQAGIPLATQSVGGMFGLFFTKATRINRFAEVMACDVDRFKIFFHGMLKEGVYLAPSAFEAGFLSAAHTDTDIAATVTAAAKVFTTLK